MIAVAVVGVMWMIASAATAVSVALYHGPVGLQWWELYITLCLWGATALSWEVLL